MTEPNKVTININGDSEFCAEIVKAIIEANKK